VAGRGNGSAWGSLVLGLGSVAVLPLAIYLTRFSDEYELLHASLAIPFAAALGGTAVALGRRARRRNELSLGRAGGQGLARAGRALGIIGVGLALAAVVALCVYGLLEYVGSRD
jgi:ABC-type Fe3+ transport system permease subunit